MFQSEHIPRGIHTPEMLKDTTRYPWYTTGYNEYSPDSAAIILLKNYNYTNNFKIIAVGGTWCGDTKNLLPKFYKVADEVGLTSTTTLILVDRKKKSGNGLEKQYHIERVPTFIIIENGKEKGRIVESVYSSIEAELVAIVMK